MKTHHTMTLRGITPVPVTVSAKYHDKFEIHGLSDAAMRETRVRVASALALAPLPLAPFTTKPRAHVTIEGAEGSCPGADLAVAVATLDAMGLLGEHVPSPLLLGELALDGRLRPVRGLYAMLRDADLVFVVPECQFEEASAASWHCQEVLTATNLQQVVAWYKSSLLRASGKVQKISPLPPLDSVSPEYVPLAETSRAFHEGPRAVLIVGAPGTGKLAAARSMAASLPVPTVSVQDEVLALYSAAGLWISDPRVPFRAPHHTVSEAGLLGGGERVRPGEVSLAHGGCLLLDEVAEFRREALRQLARVVREGEVRITRSGRVVRMPAKPALVIGTCEPRDFELARAAYPWTGVYEMTPGEVERLAVT